MNKCFLIYDNPFFVLCPRFFTRAFILYEHARPGFVVSAAIGYKLTDIHSRSEGTATRDFIYKCVIFSRCSLYGCVRDTTRLNSVYSEYIKDTSCFSIPTYFHLRKDRRDPWTNPSSALASPTTERIRWHEGGSGRRRRKR